MILAYFWAIKRMLRAISKTILEMTLAKWQKKVTKRLKKVTKRGMFTVRHKKPLVYYVIILAGQSNMIKEITN